MHFLKISIKSIIVINIIKFSLFKIIFEVEIIKINIKIYIVKNVNFFF